MSAFDHNIIEEAQHGGSYNGNACDKFMQPEVYSAICNGIVTKTKELSDCPELHRKAEEIKKKCVTLNQRFSAIHELISSAKPIDEKDIRSTEWAIQSYMSYFRKTFPNERIIPKQHMLEAHCVDWLRMWPFGLGFHGEQGGERMHAQCNDLIRRRFSGVKNQSMQLLYVMEAQHLKASPDTISSPKAPKRQRKQ